MASNASMIAGEIVAAEIVHQPRQLVVAARFDQPRHRALIADLVEQALAPRRAALEHQRRIKLVRAVIDPLPQHLAARLGEGRLLQRAVFEHDDVPAEIAEQIFVALPQALAHHGVEALPVVVDDPPAIAQALLPAFEDRLENIALVELGVAEKRDHAAFRPARVPSHGRAHNPAPARRTMSAPRRARPSRWRNRRRRYPWCATDRIARPCSRGNVRAFRGVCRPSRYWMA